MLLTLKPSSQNGVKGPPHDYAIVRQSIPTAPRSSSPPPAVSEPQTQSMESSRRGLPPPSALTLPPPDVAFAAVNPMNQQQHLPPPPPPQRQDSDASYYSWLEAKAEEDRRKQEEEKTRQETLRLEQRRIEQSMLRDSLHAGVPPHMIPLIFAGISQGGVPQSVLEVTQQYMTQSAIPPPPRGPPAAGPSMPGPSHSSSHRRAPHVRRDSRSIPSSSSSSHPYVTSTQPPVPGPGVLLSQPLHASVPSSTPQSLGRPSDPRAAPIMSRMNPGESQGSQQQPAISLSNVHYAPGSSVPLSQPSAGKSDSQPRQSPPSLYFHHWVPPAQSQPNTPSGRNRQESPGTSQAPSARRAEYQSSPGRKRKAPGPHQQAPLPSSHPSENFPGSSQNSRAGSPMISARPAEQSSHNRKRSDTSNPYDTRMSEPHGPPESTSRRASGARPAARTMTSTEETGSERGYSRTEDQDRSGYPSRSESHAGYSHPASQGPYASSVGTAPPDSDADSSPGQSPRTGASRRFTRSDASPRGP